MFIIFSDVNRAVELLEKLMKSKYQFSSRVRQLETQKIAGNFVHDVSLLF